MDDTDKFVFVYIAIAGSIWLMGWFIYNFLNEKPDEHESALATYLLAMIGLFWPFALAFGFLFLIAYAISRLAVKLRTKIKSALIRASLNGDI